MAGTKAGGIKAGQTNKKRHGDDFYRVIGKRGGEKGTTGGWAKKAPCNCNEIKGPHTKPQCRGKVGGARSRRGKVATQTISVAKKHFWDIIK